MRAYSPLPVLSSAWVPCSRIRPWSSTTTRSAWGKASKRCENGTTVHGVDHLGHPKAAIDEAQVEFQVGDEGPCRHGAADHLLASLPHHEQDASTHERGVHWPE